MELIRFSDHSLVAGPVRCGASTDWAGQAAITDLSALQDSPQSSDGRRAGKTSQVRLSGYSRAPPSISSTPQRDLRIIQKICNNEVKLREE